MAKGDFKFSSFGEEPKQAEPVTIDHLVQNNRRTDDALLMALSLVLASNKEYANSLAALLESDLSKEQKLNLINAHADKILENTKQLITSQEILTRTLQALNTDYKESVSKLLSESREIEHAYLDNKLKVLFAEMGLKHDGSEYSPSDKVVLKLKALFTTELLSVIIGAALFYAATLIVKLKGN